MTIERFEVVCREPDIAHQALNDVYDADGPMSFAGYSADFDFALRSNTAGVAGADMVRHSMAARAVAARRFLH